MTDAIAGLTVEIRAETDDVRRKLAELERLGDAFAGRITAAFESAIFSGRSFGDTLRRLALDLSRLALRAAFQPLEQAAGGFFGALFQGLAGFARGGVVGSPMPQPFAAGGVIAAPLAFPLGGRRVGVAGEAGPEAILPLRRGADGRLGVEARGGGRPVSITVTITTPDAESFRRSEGRIAALLTRAVARGQREM